MSVWTPTIMEEILESGFVFYNDLSLTLQKSGCIAMSDTCLGSRLGSIFGYILVLDSRLESIFDYRPVLDSRLESIFDYILVLDSRL